MNSTKQANKFTRFLKNNAALLLIIFSVLAIVTVVLAVTLTTTSKKPEPGNVVVNPKPDDTQNEPVVTPPDDQPNDQPQIVRMYFSAPIKYTSVGMDYTDGTDKLFVFSTTLNMWKTHKAVDLAATDGTEVSAMFGGTVIEVSESYGMGNIVKIDHGDNIVATYASLADVKVVKGQVVEKGEVIGVVSTTAAYEFSDGAHLHLEISDNGKNVDPMPYVNGDIYREVEM